MTTLLHKMFNGGIRNLSHNWQKKLNLRGLITFGKTITQLISQHLFSIVRKTNLNFSKHDQKIGLGY